MKNEELNEKLNELAKEETPEYWDKIESKLEDQPVSEETVIAFPSKIKFPLIKVASIAASFAIVAGAFFLTQGTPLDKKAALSNGVASESTTIGSSTLDKKIAEGSLMLPRMAKYKELPIAEIETLFNLKLDGKMTIPSGMKLEKALVYFTTDEKETPYLAQLTYTGANKKILNISISIKPEMVADDPKIIAQTEVAPVDPNDSVTSSDGSVTIPSDKVDPSAPTSGSEPGSAGSAGSAGSSEPGVAPDEPTGTGTISNDYVSDEYKKTIEGISVTFYTASSKADDYTSVYVNFEKADLLYDVSSENIEKTEIENLVVSFLK
ncbi:MAG: hypothetical protein WCL54_05915 [Clostridia bacterium]